MLRNLGVREGAKTRSERFVEGNERTARKRVGFDDADAAQKRTATARRKEGARKENTDR